MDSLTLERSPITIALPRWRSHIPGRHRNTTKRTPTIARLPCRILTPCRLPASDISTDAGVSTTIMDRATGTPDPSVGRFTGRSFTGAVQCHPFVDRPGE